MPKALTDVAAKNELPGVMRREVPDGRVAGLYLVVQTSGAKSWAFRYRVAGQPKKFTIGSYPAITLATARNLAQRASGDVAEGGDPAARKRTERVKAKAAASQRDDLVEIVVDDFIVLYAKKKTRDWRETERLLRKDVVPAWRGRRLPDIEKRHVVKLLDSIVDRGAPVGANRTYAQIRRMCSWAVARGILKVSPCEGIEAPSPEIERNRVLSLDELSLVWRAAARLAKPYGEIVRLLILTGARRDEVAGMCWTEVDASGQTWILPAARSKNRREHVVPLSLPAIKLLNDLPRIAGSPFVFGGGRAAPANFAKAKGRLDAEVERQNNGQTIPHWVLHDIRRSVATHLAEMKFPPHIVEALLNHRSGTIKGVAAIYNRYSYTVEKKQALDAWAERLKYLSI